MHKSDSKNRREFLKTSAKMVSLAGLGIASGGFGISLANAQDSIKKHKGAKMKIYLLNGAKEFGNSKGRLNTTLHELAKETLSKLGHETKEVIIDKGYDVQKEVQNLKWADSIIHQFPAWWMCEPWIVKKYIDEVYLASHGVLFNDDGRTRKDPSKKYGSGGLAQNKSYMLCSTWNAPLEVFTDKTQFLGIGIDGVFAHLHKAHAFCGMQKLPSFMCNDVVKNPQVERYLAEYEAHLKKVFGNA